MISGSFSHTISLKLHLFLHDCSDNAELYDMCYMFSFTNSQIFQHPLSDKVPKTVPSSVVSLIEPPVASVKCIRTYKRTGDTSTIALVVHFSTCCRGLSRVGGCARDDGLHGNH
jgi:hypothetical protein